MMGFCSDECPGGCFPERRIFIYALLSNDAGDWGVDGVYSTLELAKENGEKLESRGLAFHIAVCILDLDCE